MNKKLRIGIVGRGFARRHISVFQNMPDKFEVLAICSRNQAKVTKVAKEYGISRWFTDIADMVRAEDLDVIDLCTPPHLHFSQTMQVLNAGKHVICEKPVAGSLREADELITAETQANKRVMPIFQYRFGHGLQKLMYLKEKGLTGTAYLTTVETAWQRRADYYASWHGSWDTELGGAMVNLAIHSHDVLYYVLGPARRVLAQTATLVNPIETEDCVSASLEMADGSLASLSVTTGSCAEITRHRFCFSNLTAESNTHPYENTSDPWVFTGDSPRLETRIEETLRNFLPLPEGLAGQFYRFHQALQEDTELPITLADARASLELITAMYNSSQTGQAVELPIGKDHPQYASWRPLRGVPT
jgi:predicted dehydrogenase